MSTINNFLDYQRANKGLSDSTIEGYRKDLHHFVKYAQPLGLRWSQITEYDMTEYVKHENERGMKPRTIKKRVEVIRLLLTWAQHRGYIKENPARYTQTPRIGEELPKATDISKIERYLSKPATTRESYIIHALVAIIFETGLRISEVCSMRGEDIDPTTQSIRVRGKGRERIVYYGHRAAHILEVASHNQGRVFIDEPITYRYMMIRELPGEHPHAIRHAFACDQLNKGMDLKTLSVLMGHKNVATTEIYAKCNNAQLRAQYQSLNQ